MNNCTVKIRLVLFSLVGVIILLDQIIKAWVEQVRPYIEIIPGFFHLIYVRNAGAAFGILQGKQYLLAVVSAIAIVVLGYLLLKESTERKGLLLALSLILGGTIGNFIDRVRLKYVIDFLDFHIKTHHWPAFNVADSAISIGVALLVLLTVREEFLAKHSQE
ncbi:signal peptidase II [candidate division KSB3 bacterium]|uniref:Lipoprotein signal peptidase n=1 Tax=candidate division KSB3 bacterium TaxID=2044937 RepID=A0A2G6KMT7_9BACT|nr:MAG: signal peptidase II [candidate division KSB3 bacterium]